MFTALFSPALGANRPEHLEPVCGRRLENFASCLNISTPCAAQSVVKCAVELESNRTSETLPPDTAPAVSVSGAPVAGKRVSPNKGNKGYRQKRGLFLDAKAARGKLAVSAAKVAVATSHQADLLKLKTELASLFGELAAKAARELLTRDLSGLDSVKLATVAGISADKFEKGVAKANAAPLVNIDFGGLAAILRDRNERESLRVEAQAYLRECEARRKSAPAVIDVPAVPPA